MSLRFVMSEPPLGNDVLQIPNTYGQLVYSARHLAGPDQPARHVRYPLAPLILTRLE